MKLLNLAWVFALLSILAVGGGTAILPEMEHMTVSHFHWLTDKQFRDIYSIGQVAPGPNMLMVLLIGYKLSGWAGAIVVAVSFFLPDCILALVTNRLWVHFAASPWRAAIQRGLAPVAIGLMLAGTWAIIKLAVFTPVGVAIAFAVFGLLLWRHVNPALLITLGGIIYLAASLLH
jgi:chromate transporter